MISNQVSNQIFAADMAQLQPWLTRIHLGGDALAERFNRLRVRALVQQLLSDEQWRREVAQRSYAHGNGFDKWVLFDDGNYKLRLHIWYPGVAAEENIHNHRWNFASVVLAGSLSSDSFDWSDDCQQGEVYQHFHYQATTKQGRYGLQYQGTRRLVQVSSQRLAAGSCYGMESRLLHRIHSQGNEAVITMTLQGPAQRDWTHWFTQRDVPAQNTEVPVQHFNENTLRDRIYRCLSLIS